MESTNNRPDVSVIISVYNTGKYLKECLDTIINQSLRNIEIICVNDGSTDDSLSILEKYASNDRRVKIYSKENGGLGGASARNYGLDRAIGKYVSILDSDDFFDLTMLEKATNRAEETGADIVVIGGYEYNNVNGEKFRAPSILNQNVIPSKEVFSYKDCPDTIFQLTQGMAWNKLYRRSFIEKHGIRFQQIKFTDDAYFAYSHIVLAERITILNEMLCYYRQNTGTSQTDGLANYPESAYLPYVEIKKSLVEWGIYEDVKQSFVNCATAFIRYFYDRINRFEPLKYLHEKLRGEVFGILDISGKSSDYFYDDGICRWYEQVVSEAAEELIFKAARAYGAGDTTAILRLQFPFDLIPINSRLAIIGRGTMGKHYYAQIILKRYCEVVLWMDIEDKEKYVNGGFDFVIVAYIREDLVNETLEFLHNNGITDNKIILGGEI